MTTLQRTVFSSRKNKAFHFGQGVYCYTQYKRPHEPVHTVAILRTAFPPELQEKYLFHPLVFPPWHRLDWSEWYPYLLFRLWTIHNGGPSFFRPVWEYPHVSPQTFKNTFFKPLASTCNKPVNYTWHNSFATNKNERNQLLNRADDREKKPKNSLGCNYGRFRSQSTILLLIVLILVVELSINKKRNTGVK